MDSPDKDMLRSRSRLHQGRRSRNHCRRHRHHLRHPHRGRQIPDPDGIPMMKGRLENLDETHPLELVRTPDLEHEMPSHT